MKIVSFNVNSVRQRLHQLEALVAAHAPAVIGLQETKVSDDQFPLAELQGLGYHLAWHGQKTHYGVALMTREQPLQVVKGFAGDDEDAQRRWIGAEIALAGGSSMWVYNGYFPQGEARDHAVKFPAKERFYADVLDALGGHDPSRPLVLMGDFNVAPVDADIGIGADNARRWLRTGKASFLPEERHWLQRLFDWGLVDSYRRLHGDSDEYFSWFDYRSRGFEREPRRGLRIDHILCTAPLAAGLRGAGIDYDIRAMDKPSDHCPVWAEFTAQGGR